MPHKHTNGSAATQPTDFAILSQVTSAVAALSSVYQPLDSDLTALAALAGQTTYGRALLTLADGTALVALIPNTSITNAQLAGAIALSKLATDPLARANHTGTQAESTVTNLTTDLAAKAPLASPTFTGTPAAPTATVGTNTTQVATTAFVQAASSPASSPASNVLANIIFR